MKRFVILMLLSSLVAACGVRGGLERPAPLWGDPDQAPPAQPTPYERNDYRRDPVRDPLFIEDDEEDLEEEDAFDDFDDFE